jgi:hypothetical protein
MNTDGLDAKMLKLAENLELKATLLSYETAFRIKTALSNVTIYVECPVKVTDAAAAAALTKTQDEKTTQQNLESISSEYQKRTANLGHARREYGELKDLCTEVNVDLGNVSRMNALKQAQANFNSHCDIIEYSISKVNAILDEMIRNGFNADDLMPVREGIAREFIDVEKMKTDANNQVKEVEQLAKQARQAKQAAKKPIPVPDPLPVPASLPAPASLPDSSSWADADDIKRGAAAQIASQPQFRPSLQPQQLANPANQDHIFSQIFKCTPQEMHQIAERVKGLSDEDIFSLMTESPLPHILFDTYRHPARAFLVFGILKGYLKPENKLITVGKTAMLLSSCLHEKQIKSLEPRLKKMSQEDFPAKREVPYGFAPGTFLFEFLTDYDCLVVFPDSISVTPILKETFVTVFLSFFYSSLVMRHDDQLAVDRLAYDRFLTTKNAVMVRPSRNINNVAKVEKNLGDRIDTVADISFKTTSEVVFQPETDDELNHAVGPFHLSFEFPSIVVLLNESTRVVVNELTLMLEDKIRKHRSISTLLHFFSRAVQLSYMQLAVVCYRANQCNDTTINIFMRHVTHWVSKTTGYVAERNKPFIKNIISSMLPMFVVEGDIMLHQPTFLEADLYRKMKNKSDMMIHEQIFERLNPYLPKGGKRMTAKHAKRTKRTKCTKRTKRTKKIHSK